MEPGTGWVRRRTYSSGGHRRSTHSGCELGAVHDGHDADDADDVCASHGPNHSSRQHRFGRLVHGDFLHNHRKRRPNEIDRRDRCENRQDHDPSNGNDETLGQGQRAVEPDHGSADDARPTDARPTDSRRAVHDATDPAPVDKAAGNNASVNGGAGTAGGRGVASFVRPVSDGPLVDPRRGWRGDGLNQLDPPSVPATLELRCGEGHQGVNRDLHSEEPLPHANDVGVVMHPRQPGARDIVHGRRSCPGAGRCHGDPDATAAACETKFATAVEHRMSHGDAVVRVVDRRLAMGAEIEDFVALTAEVSDEHVFQMHASMISTGDKSRTKHQMRRCLVGSVVDPLIG